jgi:hypothetical protein
MEQFLFLRCFVLFFLIRGSSSVAKNIHFRSFFSLTSSHMYEDELTLFFVGLFDWIPQKFHSLLLFFFLNCLPHCHLFFSSFVDYLNIYLSLYSGFFVLLFLLYVFFLRVSVTFFVPQSITCWFYTFCYPTFALLITKKKHKIYVCENEKRDENETNNKIKKKVWRVLFIESWISRIKCRTRECNWRSKK